MPLLSMTEYWGRVVPLNESNATNVEATGQISTAMADDIAELNTNLDYGKVIITPGQPQNDAEATNPRAFEDELEDIYGHANAQGQTDTAGAEDSVEPTAPNYHLGSRSHKTNVTFNNDAIMQYILYLEPTLASCPGAGNCATGCLVKSGQMTTSASRLARQKKYNLLRNNRERFMDELCADLEMFIQYAEWYKRHNQIQDYFVRLNGTSDLPLDQVFYSERRGQNILQIFPNLKFVDYTKVYKGGRGTQAAMQDPSVNKDLIGTEAYKERRRQAMARVRKGNYDLGQEYGNYYVTYSYDGETHTSNQLDCEQVLADGGGVAVIFDDYHHRLPIPKSFPFGGKQYKVIIGDDSDARYLDRKKLGIPEGEGYIVGLSHKKPFGAALGYNCDSKGNNTNPQSVDLAKYYGINRRVIWGPQYQAKWCQKNLWPRLAEKGFDFYNRRLSIGHESPVYTFNPQSGRWGFHDDVESPIMIPDAQVDTEPFFRENILRCGQGRGKTPRMRITEAQLRVMVAEGIRKYLNRWANRSRQP